MTDFVLERRDFDANELVRAHPPRFQHTNKKLVHRLACPPGAIPEGRIGFSRWREMTLPEALPDREPILEVREGAFGYEAEPANVVSWYMNFADRELFGYYGGRLLAQDELQVLEHPALGSVREALVAAKVKAVTVEHGRPTPVLVTGVERRCALATEKLYGNRFAAADADTVTRATRVLSPPTRSNILAMEAPSGGRGVYRRSEIDYVLATAFTGYSAVRLESARLAPEPVVAIHTGFWGCGAFGGNRVLMALLQLLAARLARIDRLEFHTFDRTGNADLARARTILAPLATANTSLAEVVRATLALELAWGVSDGT